ncbi:MAG TPA: sulfotransferase [Candidatus Acidoferrales bacterium]|nr:sulfotransferase [Candidatus Acidoferrales bacterium]
MGYPRSGHTLVGFLLDAHPNIIVANQTSALKWAKHGFAKRQIFHLLLENSRKVALVGRQRKRYSYEVPGQWQGRFERLRVIGDSTGLTRLRRQPDLLYVLQKRLDGVKIRLIHCIRNPYDNISTMTMRRNNPPLPEAIETYFSMCEEVQEIQNRVEPAAIHVVRHEELIADPKATLRELLAFLALTADESYYADCASIIYKSPHKSRFEVPWSQELVDLVKRRMERFDYLDGYSYNDDGTNNDSSARIAPLS